MRQLVHTNVYQELSFQLLCFHQRRKFHLYAAFQVLFCKTECYQDNLFKDIMKLSALATPEPFMLTPVHWHYTAAPQCLCSCGWPHSVKSRKQCSIWFTGKQMRKPEKTEMFFVAAEKIVPWWQKDKIILQGECPILINWAVTPLLEWDDALQHSINVIHHKSVVKQETKWRNGCAEGKCWLFCGALRCAFAKQGRCGATVSSVSQIPQHTQETKYSWEKNKIAQKASWVKRHQDSVTFCVWV